MADLAAEWDSAKPATNLNAEWNSAKPTEAKPPAEKQSPMRAVLSRLLAAGGSPFMAAGQYGMEKVNEAVTKGAYMAGGAATDLAMKAGTSPETAAKVGFATNVGIETIPALLGGQATAKLASPAFQEKAVSMMQGALKPVLLDLKQGKAERAIQTMLDEGMNVTPGSVGALREKIFDLNRELANTIRNSTAKIDKNAVYDSLKETLDKFTRQVDPHADLATIRAAWDRFKNHPLFAGLGEKEAQLVANVESREAARVSALQDAGRFQTAAAQQRNLAQGGEVRLSPSQPINTAEMNVGATGGRAISPSAYPPSGPGTNVRFPERYTENAQRVPEAQSAAADALRLVEQRRQELELARNELAAHRTGNGSGVPVQLAQELKQGTYRVLGEKSYGEMKSAEVEAQKSIARGLKELIAKAEPSVAPNNAAQSELINALGIMERRVMMAGNKDLAGLSLLSKNPMAWIAMMADRSPAIKSMLANVLYSGHQRIPQAVGSASTAFGVGLEQNAYVNNRGSNGH